MPKVAAVAACHPDRKHKAKGLCNECYNVGRNATYRAKHADAILKARAKKRAENPSIYKERRLKQEYGMTVADVERMLEDQSGKCLICEDGIDMTTRHVDHCHDAGFVRGLLCGECNMGLGKFKDSTERLRKAADYLQRKPTAFRRN